MIENTSIINSKNLTLSKVSKFSFLRNEFISLFSDNIYSRSRAEYVNKMISKSSIPANIMSFATAILIASVFYSIDSQYVLYWLAPTIFIIIIRLLITFIPSYFKKTISAHLSLNLYSISTLLLGTAWGSTSLLTYEAENIDLATSMLYLAYCTIISAAIPILHSHLRSYFFYTIPLIIGGLFIVISHTTSITLLGITALLLTSSFSFIVAFKLNNSMNEQIENTQTTQALISNLRSEIQQREKAQKELIGHKNLLEDRVESRTKQLLISNEELRKQLLKTKK